MAKGSIKIKIADHDAVKATLDAFRHRCLELEGALTAVAPDHPALRNPRTPHNPLSSGAMPRWH